MIYLKRDDIINDSYVVNELEDDDFRVWANFYAGSEKNVITRTVLIQLHTNYQQLLQTLEICCYMLHFENSSLFI